MRIVPNTILKRPRFIYNLVVNGKQVVVNGKSVVVYWQEQNINTNLRTTWRPNDYTWENIPESITWENIEAYWDWLLQKNTLRRPRFTYNLIVNWKQVVVNNKNVVVYGVGQNINTIWR
jgi:hypothetical protein